MLTTAVGNYPKLPLSPDGPNLRRALTQVDSGRITQEELEEVVRQTTTDVVREQDEAGLDLLTDGQIGWNDGQTHFANGLSGFEVNGLLRYFDTNTYFRQPIPAERVQWRGPISLEAYRHASSQSTKPVKAVITGPYTMSKLSQLGCYSDRRSLALELAQALNQEALSLQEAGAPFIQFDEPAIVFNKADIGLLQETSAVLTLGLRVNTGISTWFRDISGIQREFFGLPFQVFGLDFIMGKGNYDLVDELPADRSLAAGITDARNTRMEAVEDLVQAVRRLSRTVSLDRLYLCPSAGLEYLPRTAAREKLIRLVEGAQQAQKELA